MKNTKNFFRNFGLSDIEVEIYLSLLQTGSSSILQIAKNTKVKRSTVHVNVEAMIQKGFLSETRQGSKRRILAEPPDAIENMLRGKRADLEKIEDNFNSIIADVYRNISVEPESIEKPVIRYCQGLEGFKEVCQRSLLHSDKEILFLSNIDEWYRVYTEEFDRDYYVPTRLERGIPLKMLTFETKMARIMREKDEELNRQIRFLAGSSSFSTTTIIYNNEVSMMVSSEPYTAIVIESKEFYETFLNIFRRLWRVSY